jgi:anti-sigma regulatory factor (Ser/Thr protein kinase)
MLMDQALEHDALIYGTDEELMATLVPWLQEGLERGDGAVVATTAPHIEQFRDSLGSDEGAVSFFFADDWYVQPSQTIADWQRLLVEAAANGVDHTRIVGEVRFGATPDLQTSWTRYESALNAVFEHSPAWIVCPYDARALPADVIDQAWRTHPTVWDPTRHRSDRYEVPSRLLREIVEPGRAVTGPPSLELPIDGRLGEVRRSVRALANEADLPKARAEELVLAVTELAGNTVRHAGGGGRLALWITPEGVVCEVTDQGGGVQDPLAGFVPPKPGASAGMGLWIARQLSDSFAIGADDEGTTVRIAVDR